MASYTSSEGQRLQYLGLQRYKLSTTGIHETQDLNLAGAREFMAQRLVLQHRVDGVVQRLIAARVPRQLRDW